MDGQTFGLGVAEIVFSLTFPPLTFLASKKLKKKVIRIFFGTLDYGLLSLYLN